MQPDLRPIVEVPHFPRATDYAGVWAIEPGAGAALWDLARRMDLKAHVAAAESPKLKNEQQSVPVGRQSIAVVMLTGVLMKSVSSMDDGTSTVAARREIRKAAADPSIDGIMIAIDSPGGSVSGTADLAAEVKAAAGRKPVYAFADDCCASAAYWIASQCDQVFANTDTALVGSIGTLMVLYDLSGAAAEAGIKTLVFGTGPLKGTGTPGAAVSDEQQAYITGLVEDAQVHFDAAVKKGRGMTDSQLEKVKSGGVFSAGQAQSLKLIDGIQSFDQSMQDLAAEVRRRAKVTGSTQRAASPVPIRSATMNETLTAATEPALDQSIVNMRIQAAAEAGRIAGIQQKASKHPSIIQQAISEGWSVEKTELTALRQDLKATEGIAPGNPAGPHLVFGRGKWRHGSEASPGVGVNEAIEAGLRMSLGSKDIEKQYRPEVLQAAHESFRHIGMQQCVFLAAAQNGYRVEAGERLTKSNYRQVMKAAFRESTESHELMAAASTISMPGILGAVANKELLAGYLEEDTTWRNVAAVKSVTNFQLATSFRMLDDFEYEELGPDGKIKHGTTGQESYTRQAKTYAKMFAITRQQWINDDLGAFQDVRTRLGRGSAKKFNKIFWTAFQATGSPTFFSSGRTNFITGSTTTLLTDGVGLGLAVKQFRLMKSPTADGTKAVTADTANPVGANPGGRPEILLVPPELEGNAEVLYRNQNLGSVINSGANIYQNKYRPVVAWQLSDSGFTNSSSTAWYLLNDPGYLAAVVVSFLNGMIAPTVESADLAEFDELSVQFRGYHDFGCDQAEYLCGVKSKGSS